MLDHRVYRAAFLPALVALFVLAFSLSDVPRAKTTRLAPLAFDDDRAYATMQALAERFPDRRPGSSDDLGLADRVSERIEATGFGQVRRTPHTAATIDGETELETVIATRDGLTAGTVLVIAHRDAVGTPAVAELSGTAVLLELARLFADRDLRKSVALASVSGGSGGFEGARQAVESIRGPVDAVIVLGDLAGDRLRRPFVVPWRNGGAPAPIGLERTVQSALRAELDTDPGRTRAAVQLIHRALPLTVSEQGVVDDAVLISASSERRPPEDALTKPVRMAGFGRATLRALYAIQDSGQDPFPATNGVIALKRLVPTWSIALLVLALLVPALLTAFDGFFRARRRGAPMVVWTLWAVSFALPVLAAWLWTRLLDLTGAVSALPAPLAGEMTPTGGEWAAVASTVLVAAGTGFYVLRHARGGPQLAAGAPAAATGLMLSALVLGVWLFNPYAAAVLLPAAHAWLLASSPDRRLRRGAVTLALLAGLALPALIVAYYLQAWALGPAEALWTAFSLVAGGVLGPGAALTVSGFFAALCATVAILRARRGLAQDEPAADDSLVTRGPRTYAGPGSLGGTESALRR